jgi:hypothetical protein
VAPLGSAQPSVQGVSAQGSVFRSPSCYTVAALLPLVDLHAAAFDGRPTHFLVWASEKEWRMFRPKHKQDPYSAFTLDAERRNALVSRDIRFVLVALVLSFSGTKTASAILSWVVKGLN